MLRVCLDMKFMVKFPVKSRVSLVEIAEYAFLKVGEVYYPDSDCYWVLLRGILQYKTGKTLATLKEDLMVEEDFDRMEALEECHVLKFSKA